VTVEVVLVRLGPLDVRARAMFGEFALYCDDKVVALVCDERVFLKPTAAAEETGRDFELGPPYPGAKDHLILDDAFLGDGPALRSLVQATADLLAKPRPRRRKTGPRRKKGRRG
ncbi:MAG: TfoX/Sxy family protein, partial [Planctomycetota bacterium]